MKNAADGRYAPTAHILFARLGSLFAVPFDPALLELTGGVIEVVENLQQAYQATNTTDDTGAGQFTLSETGTLIYTVGPLFQTVERTLVWVDRHGRTAALPIPGGRYLFPRLSPDGKRIAVHLEGLNDDVWVIDLERASMSRLTDEKGTDGYQTWTADGSALTFKSEKLGSPGIYTIPADRSGPAELLVDIPESHPASWTPDGRTLVFLVGTPDGNRDIWMLEPGGEPQPFLQTPFAEEMAGPVPRWTLAGFRLGPHGHV